MFFIHTFANIPQGELKKCPFVTGFLFRALGDYKRTLYMRYSYLSNIVTFPSFYSLGKILCLYGVLSNKILFYELQRTGLQIWNWCKYWLKPTRFVRRIFTYICGDYIKEHLGFLQLINFLTCRVGVGVIFIKSTKSVNFNVKNAPNGWISWCQPTNGLFKI